jgi:Holliday junction resolvasome RuvABC endonuclease subunit
MRILGVDPAMANVGWMLLEFDRLHLDVNNTTYPSWMDKDKEGGTHTYQCFQVLNKGLYTTHKSATTQERLIEQIDQIHLLVSLYKPDILAYEAQMEDGNARCTWGVALQLGIVFPYYNIKSRQVRLFRCPDFVNTSFTDMEFIPPLGVAIKPQQLQSIAQHERSTKPKIVVQRYREVTGLTHKISDHEADAYFLGVHAGRFWATCINDYWDQDLLTNKEHHVFLDSNTGMLFREGESWWSNIPQGVDSSCL